MKILQVSPVFYPAWKYGGSVPAVYNLSTELVKRGHDVTVYTTDALDDNSRHKAKYSEIEGIKVHYFRNLSNKLAWNGISLPLGIVPQIMREIKAFDIIHLQDYRTFQNVIASHYAVSYGIPYIIQPYAKLDTFFRKGLAKKAFDRLLGYRILRGAAGLIVYTSTVAKDYEGIGIAEEKIQLVPNGVDLSEFESLPERGTFRRKYGLGNEQRIVLYLGRILSNKGPDLLVEAFASIAGRLRDVTLVIAGPDAGFLPAVKKIVRDRGIEERVLFTGPIVGKDKLAAFVDADVYVLPSWYEEFGIAPLEAYACGTPVVITDRCGVAEWMARDFDYVIPYDKVRLEEVLTKILRNGTHENRCEQQSKRFRLIQERFSWAAIAERAEHIYQKTIGFGNL